MMRERHECPGLAPEMLVEAHFRSISTFARHVDFGQHYGCRSGLSKLPLPLGEGRGEGALNIVLLEVLKRFTILSAALAGAIIATASFGAEPTFSRTFNGPETTWQTA